MQAKEETKIEMEMARAWEPETTDVHLANGDFGKQVGPSAERGANTGVKRLLEFLLQFPVVRRSRPSRACLVGFRRPRLHRPM